MNWPRATIRLQFHRGFAFADARRLVPYFANLGVSHIYASPIMTARPGSAHGYDVIDPTQINPELGGEEEFRRLIAELRRHDLGVVVDIVPNHMAIGNGNRWWMDVLAKGRDSRYAKYFDIDWQPSNPSLHNKILLPILGRPYGETLAAGELTVRNGKSGPVVCYFDHEFPVAADRVSLPSELGGKTSFAPDELHRLLEAQHYRLAWWRCANDEINWRRFFDINELAAIRVEDDDVFEAVHAKLFSLYAEGLIDGVRIDHIDGLAAPERYCRKLRARLQQLDKERPPNARSGPAYLIVEKILSRDERLPASWETDGTTGYDFMDEISALFHDEAGELPLQALWERISGRARGFNQEEETARRQILQRSFSAQRDALVGALHEMTLSDLDTRDISYDAIGRVITEILAHFPVYRIYARPGSISADDRRFLSRALDGARATCLRSDVWLVDRLGALLAGDAIPERTAERQTVAMVRFQQLSAPLCAKAVEDTAFYRYGRLLSRNDVGFDPRLFALPLADFHRRMQERFATIPHAMLTTATHDHKRGEDVRARLAVLSELPDEWTQAVECWINASEPRCRSVNGATIPSAADRAILFQTIVGAWPLTLNISESAALAAFAKRISAWQEKALREAKLHSDWSAPNEDYERAAHEFVADLLAPSSKLLPEIERFVQRIARPGAANALGQLIVKLTAPGIPDIYQGTEFWDFSLVDPDNRAQVDFATRQNTLSCAGVTWQDGSLKQRIIAQTLALRKKMERVFAAGSYMPLATHGRFARHVGAYARVAEDNAIIVVFSLRTAKLLQEADTLSLADWADTHIVVPPALNGPFVNVLAEGAPSLCVANKIPLCRILPALPVALLARQPAAPPRM